jgi:hypothetical protein
MQDPHWLPDFLAVEEDKPLHPAFDLHGFQVLVDKKDPDAFEKWVGRVFGNAQGYHGKGVDKLREVKNLFEALKKTWRKLSVSAKKQYDYDNIYDKKSGDYYRDLGISYLWKNNVLKNTCWNNTDYISGDEWQDENISDAEIVAYRGPDEKKMHCFKKNDLHRAFLSASPVYRWNGAPNSLCCPDFDTRYWKLPVPASDGKKSVEYVSTDTAHRLTQPKKNSDVRVATLRRGHKDRIGSGSTNLVSAIHGLDADIYEDNPDISWVDLGKRRIFKRKFDWNPFKTV